MDRIVERIKKQLSTKFDIDKPIYGISFSYDGEGFINEPEHIKNVDDFIDLYLGYTVGDDELSDEEVEEVLEDNSIFDELDESYIANFDGEVFKHKTGIGYSMDEIVCYAFADKKEYDKWLKREKELIPELKEYFN